MSNLAILGADGNPLISSVSKMKRLRRMKINPLHSLNARSLVRALDNFEFGYLRDAALLFDVIARRDDTLQSVIPKREKEASALGWKIDTIGRDDDEAEAHKVVLEDFWNSVRCVNAYDRNEKGRFRLLIRQMMSSVSMRYAAHHIVWSPQNGRLTATFEFVPLWLFENTTGTLRYLENPGHLEGESLNPDEWMVTVGDGLMIPCSIGYFAKRQAYNDWLVFSDKFSTPGVLGRTSAKKGSPEGDMMRDAVNTFGHDWASVIYGDDGQHQSPIELIEANGNPTAMPQPALLERVDRKFAALYRGADLSTMSSKDGEGTGASLQEKEGDVLLMDDAAVMSETLEAVSNRVLQWHFGSRARPRAKLTIQTPANENLEFILKASGELADRGTPVSQTSVADRLGIETADTAKGEAVLGKIQQPEQGQLDVMNRLQGQSAAFNALDATILDIARERLANSRFETSAAEKITGARKSDLAPLAAKLLELLDEEDPAKLKQALEQVSAELPLAVPDASASEDAWFDFYMSALANGWGDDPTNTEN